MKCKDADRIVPICHDSQWFGCVVGTDKKHVCVALLVWYVDCSMHVEAVLDSVFVHRVSSVVCSCRRVS